MSEDRLDSWKEIAAYLRRDVTTVQRWERREAMPVHRHLHDKVGSVYAFRTELDSWARNRRVDHADTVTGAADSVVEAAVASSVSRPASSAASRRWTIRLSVIGAAIATALVAWYIARGHAPGPNALARARFQQLTDFGGAEQAAALSRDGRFVALLSDRDGRMDVLVSQIGTGQFHNLTGGTAPELVNPSIRTLAFSPDGSLVTFWVRKPGATNDADIGIWAVPILGGPSRPYFPGIAEYDWSDDGAHLVYHTTGPGDPMFVRDRDQPARQIFSAAPGMHAHFPVWSPDQSFIYFVQGVVPDRMDIWRIRPTGGTPERITNHESRVSHPVFLNARTLLYLASDSDGSGPRLYSIEPGRTQPERLSFGVERYTSLAGRADSGRLVATISRTEGALWRVPFSDGRVELPSAQRIKLATGNGVAPRFGPDFLLYVSSTGESDSIWKVRGGVATALWSVPGARITGAPAIAQDGTHIAFVAERERRTSLYVANTDGTGVRVLAPSLQLQGAPAWAPDGRSVTVAAVVGGSPRLFHVPLDGVAPTEFIHEHSIDPAWSNDGNLLVYTGPDIGTKFSTRAVAMDGRASQLPTLTLPRGSRRLCFLPGGRSLIVLRGEMEHKDLWLVDLETGAERQLTHFGPQFNVRDFDISPDGREIVVEETRERSDVVLIELQRR